MAIRAVKAEIGALPDLDKIQGSSKLLEEKNPYTHIFIHKMRVICFGTSESFISFEELSE